MIEVDKNISPQEQLQPKKAIGLLLLSFKFSQGKPELQRKIFKYLHTIYPNLEINNTTKESITTQVMPIILNYINHTPEKAATISPTPNILHSYLSPSTPTDITNKEDLEIKMEEEAKERIRDMQEIFNTDPQESIPSIPEIASGIIERDFKFLYEREGRARSNPDTNKTVHDPWLSHVCHYGFNGNPTGLSEFDRMFKDIKDYLITYGTSGLSRETDSQLDHVMRIHNEKHPQAQV